MAKSSKFSHRPEISTYGYADLWLDPIQLRKAIKLACKFLKPLEFDAVAFRGMSGAMYAAPLAYFLNRQLIMVRKPGEHSHSTDLVEGDRAAKTYIVVDDFVSSGETVRQIRRAVRSFAPEAKYLGTMQMRPFVQNGSYRWEKPDDPHGKLPMLTQDGRDEDSDENSSED